MSNWAKTGKVFITIWLVIMAFGVLFALIGSIAEPYMLLLTAFYAIVWYSVYSFMKEVK